MNLKLIRCNSANVRSADTFNQPSGPRRRDDQRAASSLLQAHALVESGHAEGGGVHARWSGTAGGGAVAGLAAVALYLQHAQLLVGEVRADLAEVGHDDEPVGDRQEDHVGRLQETRDAQRLEAVEGLRSSWEERHHRRRNRERSVTVMSVKSTTPMILHNRPKSIIIVHNRKNKYSSLSLPSYCLF